MAKYEKLAISLRQDDLSFLDQVVAQKSVGRSAVIRWAIDHYRAFFVANNSTCQIIPDVESRPTPIEPTPDIAA